MSFRFSASTPNSPNHAAAKQARVSLFEGRFATVRLGRSEGRLPAHHAQGGLGSFVY